MSPFRQKLKHNRSTRRENHPAMNTGDSQGQNVMSIPLGFSLPGQNCWALSCLLVRRALQLQNFKLSSGPGRRLAC